jgi:hypothetical protein
MEKTRLLLLLALMVGTLTACAGQTTGHSAPPSLKAQPAQSPEDALRARATKFWEARVKGDLATQYDLIEPKAREQVTLTGFVRARSSLVFKSYKIESVEVAGDQGRVMTMTTFRLDLPQASRFGPWDQLTNMKWVKVDGQWYVMYEQKDFDQPLQAGERRP